MKIYNHSEQVGSYKFGTDPSSTIYKLLSVYKTDGSKIIEARRPDGSTDADWDVTVMSTNQKITLLYDNASPLEKLFKYLVEKGYFN